MAPVQEASPARSARASPRSSRSTGLYDDDYIEKVHTNYMLDNNYQYGGERQEGEDYHYDEDEDGEQVYGGGHKSGLRQRSSRTLRSRISQRASVYSGADEIVLEEVIDETSSGREEKKEKFDISEIPASCGFLIPLVIVFFTLYVLQTFAFSMMKSNGLPWIGEAGAKEENLEDKYKAPPKQMWALTQDIPGYLAMCFVIFLPCKKTIWDLTKGQVFRAMIIAPADLCSQVLAKNGLALTSPAMYTIFSSGGSILFTALAARFIVGKKFNIFMWLGLTVMISGVATYGMSKQGSNANIANLVLGTILILIGSVADGVTFVLIEKFSNDGREEIPGPLLTAIMGGTNLLLLLIWQCVYVFPQWDAMFSEPLHYLQLKSVATRYHDYLEEAIANASYLPTQRAQLTSFKTALEAPGVVLRMGESRTTAKPLGDVLSNVNAAAAGLVNSNGGNQNGTAAPSPAQGAAASVVAGAQSSLLGPNGDLLSPTGEPLNFGPHFGLAQNILVGFMFLFVAGIIVRASTMYMLKQVGAVTFVVIKLMKIGVMYLLSSPAMGWVNWSWWPKIEAFNWTSFSGAMLVTVGVGLYSAAKIKQKKEDHIKDEEVEEDQFLEGGDVEDQWKMEEGQGRGPEDVVIKEGITSIAGREGIADAEEMKRQRQREREQMNVKVDIGGHGRGHQLVPSNSRSSFTSSPSLPTGLNTATNHRNGDNIVQVEADSDSDLEERALLFEDDPRGDPLTQVVQGKPTSWPRTGASSLRKGNSNKSLASMKKQPHQGSSTISLLDIPTSTSGGVPNTSAKKQQQQETSNPLDFIDQATASRRSSCIAVLPPDQLQNSTKVVQQAVPNNVDVNSKLQHEMSNDVCTMTPTPTTTASSPQDSPASSLPVAEATDLCLRNFDGGGPAGGFPTSAGGFPTADGGEN
ncbi:unnamed protein product [Amoebophrya sp. A25]|nr:unnamed protein product [Amoebophrya sp. A25]|eukprot:GSA25T00025489001.1